MGLETAMRIMVVVAICNGIGYMLGRRDRGGKK